MGATYSAHRQTLEGAAEGVSPQQLRQEIEELEAITPGVVRSYFRNSRARVSSLPAFLAARRIVASWLREILQNQQRMFNFATDDQIRKFIKEQWEIKGDEAMHPLPVGHPGTSAHSVIVPLASGAIGLSVLMPDTYATRTDWIMRASSPMHRHLTALAGGREKKERPMAHLTQSLAVRRQLVSAVNETVAATEAHPYFRSRLRSGYAFPAWQAIRDLNIQAAEWILSVRFGRQMAAGHGRPGQLVVRQQPPALPPPGERALQSAAMAAERKLGTEPLPADVTSIIAQMAVQGVGPEEYLEGKEGWLAKAWQPEPPFIQGPRGPPPPPPPSAGAAGGGVSASAPGLGLGALTRQRKRKRLHVLPVPRTQ